jgi:cell division protein FtsQ
MMQLPTRGSRRAGRGSFRALRVSRRIAVRTGGDSAKRPKHQVEVRRRRVRILVLLAAALGIEVAAAALTSPLLGVNRIAVRGAEQLPEAEAAATGRSVAIPAGSNLLRAPLSLIESRAKALPWVRDARAQWLAPHALGVRILPRTPAVVALIGAQRVEVDESGVPIRPVRSEGDEGLPAVEVDRAADVHFGAPIRDEALMAAIDIYHDAPRQPMARIAKIKVDPGGNMCLNMVDGIRVDLGRPEDLDAKMKYVQRIYELEPGVGTRVMSINLSVPKQPACTLKRDVANEPSVKSAQPAPSSPPMGGGSSL